VLKRSQGTGGVADVVFKGMVEAVRSGRLDAEGIVWRSRRWNPVNKWVCLYFLSFDFGCVVGGMWDVALICVSISSVQKEHTRSPTAGGRCSGRRGMRARMRRACGGLGSMRGFAGRLCRVLWTSRGAG
jgi:hypothetical protein